MDRIITGESRNNPIEHGTPCRHLNQFFEVHGKSDLIAQHDLGTIVLHEVKATKRKALTLDDPYSNHVDQLQFYLNATGIEQGIINYVDSEEFNRSGQLMDRRYPINRGGKRIFPSLTSLTTYTKHWIPIRFRQRNDAGNAMDIVNTQTNAEVFPKMNLTKPKTLTEKKFLDASNIESTDLAVMPKRSRETVSYNMSRIRSQGTKPEAELEAILKTISLGYISHPNVYGHPDFAYPELKIALFADSAFWHGYDWESMRTKIKTNKKFWEKKIEKTMSWRSENQTIYTWNTSKKMCKNWKRDFRHLTN